MSVLPVGKVYDLLDGHTLPELVADKIFLFYRTPRHVAGAVNQKQLAALATGTFEIRRHQSHLILKIGIIARR
ncbi:MAG: hypothetical protein JRH12_13735 [Deltaproteobacteria bacterium]|jgi:hypothetical protein|nr:hypothetical protein [Deltaproteobacteria bacterium]